MFNVQCWVLCSVLRFSQSQEYDLGCFLRETYLNPASPSYIQGINTDVVDIDQLFVRADAGGGNVILDSAYALLQGLYPPTSESTSILGNGTIVESPLGGYQYIPVESLEFWQAPSLTGWMDCEVSVREWAVFRCQFSFSSTSNIT
jgi:prostatic aicd phosphatase